MSSFEEKLIEEVRKYEHLYITTHKHYYGVSMKDNAWREIAETLNSNGKYFFEGFTITIICLNRIFQVCCQIL